MPKLIDGFDIKQWAGAAMRLEMENRRLRAALEWIAKGRRPATRCAIEALHWDAYVVEGQRKLPKGAYQAVRSSDPVHIKDEI